MSNTISVLNRNIAIDKIKNPKLKNIIDKYIALKKSNKTIPCGHVQYDCEYVDYWDNCYKDGGWG